MYIAARDSVGLSVETAVFVQRSFQCPTDFSTARHYYDANNADALSAGDYGGCDFTSTCPSDAGSVISTSVAGAMIISGTEGTHPPTFWFGGCKGKCPPTDCPFSRIFRTYFPFG